MAKGRDGTISRAQATPTYKSANLLAGLSERLSMKKFAVIAGVGSAAISYWFAVIVAGQFIINSLYLCHSELREPYWSQCREGQNSAGLVIFCIAQAAFTLAIWRTAPYFKNEGD